MVTMCFFLQSQCVSHRGKCLLIMLESALIRFGAFVVAENMMLAFATHLFHAGNDKPDISLGPTDYFQNMLNIHAIFCEAWDYNGDKRERQVTCVK
jgi:hypothetical protein